MQLAIDLTPRQAARVLEQALRARADLSLEPRNLPEGEPLRGRLLGRDGELLSVELIDDRVSSDPSVLVGAFCEMGMSMSGEMYVFTSCVLDVVEDTSPRRLLMVVPEIIQVANRRRFERTNATIASQVRIWTRAQTTPTIGLLANVSAEGLACTLPGTALDSAIAIGDELRVSFELAGFDEQFEIPVILCNKNITRDKQQLFLGMEFNVKPDDPAAQHSLERVRAALFELTSNLTDMDGDL